jgi:hypothetical protein
MCVLDGPTGAALLGGHYRAYIISDVCYPRSDSVVLQVLCTVTYNFWGTNVILQVYRDNVNYAENV